MNLYKTLLGDIQPETCPLWAQGPQLHNNELEKTPLKSLPDLTLSANCEFFELGETIHGNLT